MRRLLFVLALVLLETSARLPHQFRWNRLRRHRDLEHDRVEFAKSSNAVPKEQYFTQKLCHFNPNVTGTWKQRFWQNDQYYKDNGVQFLNIGGEGEESPYAISIESIPMVGWAKKLGARLWNLEHRFYGKSRPLKDQSVENLKFLNSRQALEDLADFIKAKNDELKITNPKWVVFGGSYPGALTLWFRQKHPELTVGGVGSSAPVELTVDFFDYLRVCEDSYRTYDNKCADNIKAGFEALHKMMDTKSGRNQVDQVFNLEPSLASLNLTYTNLQNFYMAVLGNFMVAVQYSRVNAGIFKNAASIPDVCKIMTGDALNAVVRLVKVYHYINEQFGDDSDKTYDSYDEEIVAFKETSFDSPYAGDRSWVWQTCNEFGYFQSTTYNGIWGSDVPVNYYYNLCTDIFGEKYGIDWTTARVQASVDNYGRARAYNGTNVVIPNGSLDPWHALGTYVQNNPTAIPFLIQGTAHCADMEPESPNDVEDLKKVRTLIFQKLQEWTGVNAQSRAERLVEKKVDVNVAKSKESLKARRAPEFDAKICWNCGKPTNEHLKQQKASQEVSKKLERRLIGGRPRGGFLNRLSKKAERLVLKESITESYIEQPVDHFNKSDTRTYKQLFYGNDKYYKPGGPIFLFISGESEADDYWVSADLPLIQWAKKYNAYLFEVEHRFYGSSQPTDNMSFDNLKYLTSEQALADLATFVQAVNKKQGWTDAKWIPYGGSYAGALTAWFREVYPDITFAAIGSSGPVQAEVDFYGYLKTVEASLRTYSDECVDNLRNALLRVHNLFETWEGRQVLNDKLLVEPPLTKDPIDSFSAFAFFSALLDPIMGNVQYSDSYNGVTSVCDYLTDPYTKDLVDRLQNIKEDYPTYWNYQDIINELKSDSDDRAWIWQTCNEFGFYQSSDIGRAAFGSALPVNFYLNFCSDAYDKSLTRDKLEQNMDVTNDKYGGARNYKSSKVLQLYGTIDPWHSLGYYPVDGNQGDDVVSILINGTSHCSDMTKSGDPGAINQALQTVEQYLDKWLKN